MCVIILILRSKGSGDNIGRHLFDWHEGTPAGIRIDNFVDSIAVAVEDAGRFELRGMRAQIIYARQRSSDAVILVHQERAELNKASTTRNSNAINIRSRQPSGLRQTLSLRAGCEGEMLRRNPRHEDTLQLAWNSDFANGWESVGVANQKSPDWDAGCQGRQRSWRDRVASTSDSTTSSVIHQDPCCKAVEELAQAVYRLSR